MKKIIESVKECFIPNGDLVYSLHFLKKMRLNAGKEYFFSGYIFLEISELDFYKLCILENGKKIIRFFH